jgi:hypothetical protein
MKVFVTNQFRTMQFFKNIEWTPVVILKTIALGIVAVGILAFFFEVVRPAAYTSLPFMSFRAQVDPTMPGFAMRQDEMSEPAYVGNKQITLSLANVGRPVPPGGSIGADAEEYEATDYAASIETRNREKTCADVAGLKALSYVIFESTNEYDRGCSFAFKVEHARVAEILEKINTLNPKNLSENTYTIKEQIDDFTSETEILEKKLAAIDETLEGALDAYDAVTSLAVKTQNAEALAAIVSSKLGIIERLSQERILVSGQLERLARAKAAQTDKLTYTHFRVDVYENKFVDGEYLRDSWKSAVQDFFRNANRILQDVSINLVLLVIIVVQYALYILLAVFFAKYLWKAVVYIWKK